MPVYVLERGIIYPVLSDEELLELPDLVGEEPFLDDVIGDDFWWKVISYIIRGSSGSGLEQAFHSGSPWYPYFFSNCLSSERTGRL